LYLDEESFASGGGYGAPLCLSCKQPIVNGQPSTRVTFRTDPDGHAGLTGDYHLACSRPFASLAHVINLDPWGR
jgi:hypothetical protein